MNRRLVGVVVALACGVVSVAPMAAAEFPVGEHVFTVPDGFVIEQVAGPGLVDRPITCDFDEQGRLYVSDSSGSNEPTAKQVENPTHRILRLEDADGDGKFDKSVVYADKMMFPEGTMWLDGSLYVAAPPSIWKLTDADGDGVAEKREEWFKGKTLTGCANDLHGPYRGPDGWIYWCKGAFAEQTYERPDRKPLVTRASHIFRCRPDGSGIESVMTGGMDNPVDCVFTAQGERVFNTTFFVHPGNGQRDGLIHAIYGGVYGKDHEVLNGHPRTGDLMPVLAHLGPAAPAGLERLQSDGLGEDWKNNVLCCQFNKHKVSRHKLTYKGAALEATDEEFVVSSHVDFHPTDVIEDADGSVLICDTGGWYKLCCPTSQLAKPDVLGGIYRVRRVDAKPVVDPRGRKIDWAKASARELLNLATDWRPAVREHAQQVLAKRGDDEFSPLLENDKLPSASTRAALAWAASRRSSEFARGLDRAYLADNDPAVVAIALHSVSLHRNGAASGKLGELLSHAKPWIRRLAAEAIGRVGAEGQIPKLLQAAETAGDDRALEHAIAYALIELGDVQATREGLASKSPVVRRIALAALDQMDEAGGPDAGLEPTTVADALDDSDKALRDRALWIVRQHADWGPALAARLGERRPAGDKPEESAVWGELIGALIDAKEIQAIAAATLVDSKASDGVKTATLAAMRSFAGKEPPAGWTAAVRTAIATAGDERRIDAAIETARSLKLATFDPELLAALQRVAVVEGTPRDRALNALAAASEAKPAIDKPVFDMLARSLESTEPVAQRMLAADCLTKAELTLDQRAALAKRMTTVGPLELGRLLTAFEGQTETALGLALVHSLAEAEAVGSLRPERLKAILGKFDPSVSAAAEPLFERLEAELKQQRERLERVHATLPAGDVRRGHNVFASAKAACVACHAMGYLGANVGPDLTKIGTIRTEKDLLESILFPNMSFVRSYEPVVIALEDGRQFSGLIRRESGKEIVLATGPNKEERIPRDEVEEITPGSVSIMPAGLEKQLSTQELADLIAFLKAAK